MKDKVLHMTKHFILLLLLFSSCSEEHGKHKIYFDRMSGIIQISDSISFDSIRVSKIHSDLSFSIPLDGKNISSINILEQIRSEWKLKDSEQLDTLSYNIYFKLRSIDEVGYNMIFGYINSKEKFGKKLDTIFELKR